MTELEIKLADALSQERLVRSIGQDPNVHWESIRDLRRECYAQTDEALAAYEQARAEPRKPVDIRAVFLAGRRSYATPCVPMNSDEEAWQEYMDDNGIKEFQ